jgi:hypothetical protein
VIFTPPDFSQNIWRASHTPTTRLEVKRWDEPDSAYATLNVASPELVLYDGSVTHSRSNPIRRDATLNFAGSQCLPSPDWSGPISPHNRYRIWKGARMADGSMLEYLQGTFMVTDINPAREQGGPVVELSLADEMKLVELDTLAAPLGVAQGVRLTSLIRWLLTGSGGFENAAQGGNVEYQEYDENGEPSRSVLLPTFVHPITEVGYKDSPVIVTEGPSAVNDPEAVLGEDSTFTGSRVGALDTISADGNLVVHLDKYGQVQVSKSLVDYDATAYSHQDLVDLDYVQWTFDAGRYGTMIDRKPGWNIDNIANKVRLVSGDFGYDEKITTGPLSPAELGVHLPYFEDLSGESFGDSLPKLKKHARRIAREKLGAARQVTFSAVPLPFLTAEQWVASDRFTGDDTYELLLIDEVTMPLSNTDAMTVTASKVDVDNFPA